ncbi:MAG: hypothetical protein LBJ00_08805 [Planctomycetaceae bacterium]|nr:hypothetical protein [Planctomycetaceae bacterium]
MSRIANICILRNVWNTELHLRYVVIRDFYTGSVMWTVLQYTETTLKFQKLNTQAQ